MAGSRWRSYAVVLSGAPVSASFLKPASRLRQTAVELCANRHDTPQRIEMIPVVVRYMAYKTIEGASKVNAVNSPVNSVNFRMEYLCSPESAVHDEGHYFKPEVFFFVCYITQRVGNM